jgi:hypothetical protein
MHARRDCRRAVLVPSDTLTADKRQFGSSRRARWFGPCHEE